MYAPRCVYSVAHVGGDFDLSMDLFLNRPRLNDLYVLNSLASDCDIYYEGVVREIYHWSVSNMIFLSIL